MLLLCAKTDERRLGYANEVLTAALFPMQQQASSAVYIYFFKFPYVVMNCSCVAHGGAHFCYNSAAIAAGMGAGLA